MDLIKEKAKDLYASPEVEVLEISGQQALCQSGNSQQYSDGSTEDWYD